LYVLELGLIFSPIFIPLPIQIFLSSCWKILGHLIGVFIFLDGLKITRMVEKSFGSYLTVLNNSMKRFGGLFFSFSQVSSFSHLLSSRPSRLFILYFFCFFLLHLAHFSLNSQGRLHAGWFCLVFLLEKKGLCCS
jgi:membrane protease YdiL (CAAX protease family)